MALIENLTVALGLKSKAFSEGMKKAQVDFKAFESSIVGSKLIRFGKYLGAAFAGFVGVQSVTSFINKIHQSMQLLDADAKIIDKLGLSAEGFYKLKFAAGLSGVSVEQLDTAMQKMLRNMSEGRQGNKDIFGAFSQLGITMKDLKTLAPEQLVVKLADGFNKVGNSADKVNLAVKLFGKSGVGMLNLLKEGGEGLGALYKRAEELGIVFSRFELATVEAANDQWDMMKQSLDAVFMRIGVDIAPAVIFLAKEIEALVLTSREFGAEFGTALDYAAYGMGAIVDITVLLTAQFRVLSNLLAALGAGFSGLVPGQFKGAMAQMDMYLERANKAVEDFKKALGAGFRKDIERELERIKNKFREMKSESDEAPFEGVDQRVTPGAYERGTRAAAEAASKAGANDRMVEVGMEGVIKVSAIDRKMDRMLAGLDSITKTVGAEAGIA